MAKPAGLSFENPLYQDANGVPSAVVNPFGFTNAGASSGSDALRDDMASLAMLGERGVQLARQNRFTMPEMNQPSAPAYYSPANKQFFVQGVTFAEDDAQSLLDSQQLFGGTPVRPPSNGDWVPVDQQTYGQFIQNVRNPSLGRLASRNFGRGVDQAQMIVGQGLQLAGAEQLGGRIVAQQMEDLRRTAPYERQFTDIDSGRGAIEWLVANFAQQGPNLIETIATMGAGFLAGTASSGNPLGGAAAALAATIGKEAWKNSVKAALTKRAAGQVLSPDETTLLRNAAGVGLATAATFGQSMATGAADIYGELREQGADADDVTARMKALAGSPFYALADTLPEALLVGRLLGRGARPALGSLPTGRAKAGELLKRGGIGLGVGGAVGGTGEVLQESLLLGLSDQDFSAPENISRLINSFAAGAAIGGPIGLGTNLANPTNLLQKGVTTQPVAGQQDEIKPTPSVVLPTPNAPIPTSAQIDLPLQGGMVTYGPTEFAPGAQAGSQGVLDIGLPTQPLSPQEVALRGQPAVSPPLAAPVAAPEQLDMFAPQQPQPQQLPFQFAPAAPSGVGFTEREPVPDTVMAQRLQTALRQQQFQQAQQQRAQQEAAQREADLERLAVQAQNQRQLDLVAQQPAPVVEPMPMRQAGPTQPRQLELFTRGQAPRPSRAEGLRRGVGTRLPEPTGPTPLTAAERRKQGNLFTQEGQPTVAALKSAGKKTKVAKPAPKPRATQTAGARGFRRGARVSEVTVKEPTSAVQEPSPAPVSARKGAGTGQAMGAEVPAKQEVAGKGEALKAKTKKPAAKKPLKKEPPAPAAEVVERDYAEQVLAKYNDLPGDQRDAVAQRLGLTRAQMPDAIFDRTEDVDGAVAEVRRQVGKEPPPKKPEAAPAAAPSVAEGPVAVTLELADGTKIKTKDAAKLRDRLDRDIAKFEALLDCLKKAT